MSDRTINFRDEEKRETPSFSANLSSSPTKKYGN